MQPRLVLQDRVFEWGTRTYIMGVLNVTPDSFSDGGQFNTLESALNQAQQMVKAGVDIIDIGGQSTRPGAEQISLEEELNRVIPVVELLRSQSDEVASIPLSIDTTRAIVAEKAIAAGADLINDISGGTFEPEILSVVAKLGVPIIVMHIRGTPKTMQQLTDYQDLMAEISRFFQAQVQASESVGIKPSQIILDPGIGFAKTYEQNLEIFRQLPKLRSLGFPLLVGPSRKSFIGHILGESDPQKRVWGTAAACVAAIAGTGDILRVHDVKEMVDVCRVADAIYRN
ncbi:MAG: dihydropteroate synthase [Cyanobacteriota bacterium]|nr:dihydropteroate synthase [Cyanobacteriota bacterium]